MSSKRFSVEKILFKKRWSDFFHAVFVPETIFFAVMTLFCFLASFLPFDSSTIKVAAYIPYVMNALSVAFSGFTVVAFQKNNNSVIDRRKVYEGGLVVKRRIIHVESEIENLSALACNKGVTKRELNRHLQSLLCQTKLIKDDLDDLVVKGCK